MAVGVKADTALLYSQDGLLTSYPNPDEQIKLSKGDIAGNSYGTENNITFQFVKNASSNSNVDTNGVIRWYKGDEIVITANNGALITGIKIIEPSDQKRYTISGIQTAVTTTPSTSNTATTANHVYSWTDNKGVTKATITNSAQVRFTGIAVTYTSGALEPVKLEFPAEEYTVNIGDAFDSPVLTVTPADLASQVTYSSEVEEVATVAADGKVTILGVGTTKITATFAKTETYAGASASYTLKVIDPNAVQTDITPDFFNYKTAAYATASNTDDFGVTYSTVYYYTSSGMQFNTNNSNGKGSGINVTANNTEYIIDKIDIECASGSKALKVYSYDGVFAALEKTKALTIPAEAKLVKQGITANATVEINAKAFAIVPAVTGVIVVSKVTVYYKKTTDQPTVCTTPFVIGYDYQNPTKYEVGDAIRLSCGNDTEATIYFTLDGTEPVVPAAAAAPRRAADVVVDYEKTGTNVYVPGNPIIYDGGEFNLKFVAAKAGAENSPVQEFSINANGETTGIEGIAADNAEAPVEYYNLQGVKVENPANGIFIRRQGNTVAKVLVK